MSVLSRLATALPRLSSILRISAIPRAMPVATGSPEERATKRIKLDTQNGIKLDTQNGEEGVTPVSPKISTKKSKKQQKMGPTTNFRPLDTLPTAEQMAEIQAVMAREIEFPRKYAHEVEYRNKLVLAPMVRTGTLPTRLLSLYYGAGLVWSPEIVDKAIIGAQRDVDPVTGVITYHKGQGPVFTCHPVEKPFLIFQIGSSDPELAVQAARVVAQDVSGIDLNCGCPKPFSTHAGMGAALLSTPDLLLNILRALLDNIPLPISAKIRLMPTRAETMLLASRILATGVRNLTVHCRTRDMRPGEKAIHARLAEVSALGRDRGVSVTCNGDGEGVDHWATVKAETHADSLMIARAAECNPSCFGHTVDATTVIVPQLLSFVAYTGHNWGNTKFLLSQFKAAGPTLNKQQKKDVMSAVSRGKSVEEVTAGINAVVPIEVSAEKGKAFMEELEAKLRKREEWGIWDAREAERDAAIAAMHAEVASAEAATGAAAPVAANATTATSAAAATAATAASAGTATDATAKVPALEEEEAACSAA